MGDPEFLVDSEDHNLRRSIEDDRVDSLLPNTLYLLNLKHDLEGEGRGEEELKYMFKEDEELERALRVEEEKEELIIQKEELNKIKKNVKSFTCLLGMEYYCLKYDISNFEGDIANLTKSSPYWNSYVISNIFLKKSPDLQLDQPALMDACWEVEAVHLCKRIKFFLHTQSQFNSSSGFNRDNSADLKVGDGQNTDNTSVDNENDSTDNEDDVVDREESDTCNTTEEDSTTPTRKEYNNKDHDKYDNNNGHNNKDNNKDDDNNYKGSNRDDFNYKDEHTNNRDYNKDDDYEKDNNTQNNKDDNNYEENNNKDDNNYEENNNKQSNKKTKVFEAFAGVGANMVQFASWFDFVVGTELNAQRVEMCVNNSKVYGVSDKCVVLNADFVEFSESYLKSPKEYFTNVFKKPELYNENAKKQFDWVFLSPPWGGANYKGSNSDDVYSLSGPFPIIYRCVKLASLIGDNLTLYVPRSQSLLELVKFASVDCFKFVLVDSYLMFPNYSKIRCCMVHMFNDVEVFRNGFNAKNVRKTNKVNFYANLRKSCLAQRVNFPLDVVRVFLFPSEFYFFNLLAVGFMSVLNESNQAVFRKFEALLKVLSASQVMGLINLALEIYYSTSTDGLKTKSGDDRTLGGTFFYLLKVLYRETYRRVEKRIKNR